MTIFDEMVKALQPRNKNEMDASAEARFRI